ncbi:MAG: alpha/beta hydrolase [Chthoniobacterales bacterium]
MTTSETQVFRDIPYAKYGDREVLLDVYLPADTAKPFPTILSIPGGGWRVSPKENVPSQFAKKGFAVVSITYRSSAEVLAPGNVHDCKAAVRWIRANASTYGFDSAHIGAFGISAGGHLVEVLGTTAGVKDLEGDGGNPDFDSSVQAVCGLCGPCDLTRITIPKYKENYPDLYQVTFEYLGGPVEEKLDLARLVSPLAYVSKNTVPMMLVHGDIDPIVPLDESLVFHDALKEAGVDVSLKVVKGAGHGIPWGDAEDDLALSFFKRCFKK